MKEEEQEEEEQRGWQGGAHLLEGAGRLQAVEQVLAVGGDDGARGDTLTAQR